MGKYIRLVLILLIMTSISKVIYSEETIKIGLNYPKTGPYEVQGLDQWRAAQLAMEEINKAGGILGKKIEIIARNSQSNTEVTERNVYDLINQGVKMIFGGSSSAVAIKASEICQEKGVLFFGTLTYSTDTTGKDAHRYSFRECSDSWMSAKAIASYLNRSYSKQKYFYITADYTWGWTTEDSFRKFTVTRDKSRHKSVLTPFPGATDRDFRNALEKAKKENPKVLVLVLFGYDMARALRLAAQMKLKERMKIIVPNITLGMAESAGVDVMEGIIGTLPWCWSVPYKYFYDEGINFVEKFAGKYNRYPSTSGASAYTILYEYKNAVERSNSFDNPQVIKALENHEYTLLKNKQVWRDFDHQSIQTVYIVKGKSKKEISQDKFKLDYFKIIKSISGNQLIKSRPEWNEDRRKASKSTFLESLPGE